MSYTFYTPLSINDSLYKLHLTVTVEPRFNEVPRDWGNLLVKSRVRYIQHLHLKKFRENYQNVPYIEE